MLKGLIMIYLDNSSTTHKKPRKVIATFKKVLKNSSNPSRSAYPLSLKTSMQILKTRENIASFFNLKNPNNVIFTSGCTESLNLALIGCAKKNGHIITTCFEHNSVLRTLNHLKSTQNINYSIVTPSKNGNFTTLDFENKIKENTYLIIVNHTSNVNGNTINLKEIGDFCKKHNFIFAVDSAQSAGHFEINMEKFNINLLCIAGHKGLLSPEGVGALLINKISLKPIKFGGTGSDSFNLNQPTNLPEGFEAGTQNIPAILALNEGVKYVSKNFSKISKKTESLTLQLLEHLKKIPNITIFNNNTKSGVVSINLKDYNIDELYNYLCTKNICTRNGFHCAPLTHNYFHSTTTGLIRISINHTNKKRDIKILINAINTFISKANPTKVN